MDKQYRCSLSRLLFSYWKGEEKKRAWGMAITIAALTVAAVYMTLLLNDWFNSFYSALQNYDQQAIYHGLIQFTVMPLPILRLLYMRIISSRDWLFAGAAG